MDLISHLLFANDLIILGKASSREVSVIHRCLQKFVSLSGQSVNATKSSLLFNPNTLGENVKDIKSLLRLHSSQFILKTPGASYLFRSKHAFF